MAKPILDDQLWAWIEPHLPAQKPRRFRSPGRKLMGHRQALTGILFVLMTGVPWQMLPKDGSLSMAKVSVDSRTMGSRGGTRIRRLIPGFVGVFL